MIFYLLSIFNFTGWCGKSQHFQRGFFLMEVLCILFMIAFMMYSLGLFIVHGTKTSAYVRERMEAVLLARSIAERYAARMNVGTFTFHQDHYDVVASVTPDPVIERFYDVLVTVSSPRCTIPLRTGFFL
jgi:hypothetical protein